MFIFCSMCLHISIPQWYLECVLFSHIQFSFGHSTGFGRNLSCWCFGKRKSLDQPTKKNDGDYVNVKEKENKNSERKSSTCLANASFSNRGTLSSAALAIISAVHLQIRSSLSANMASCSELSVAFVVKALATSLESLLMELSRNYWVNIVEIKEKTKLFRLEEEVREKVCCVIFCEQKWETWEDQST